MRSKKLPSPPASPLPPLHQQTPARATAGAAKAPAAPLITPSFVRRRRTALITGAVAIITVAGTLIGASIKSNQQIKEKKAIRQRVEVSTAEHIALLESSRGALVAQKDQLERKIEQLRERQRKKAAADTERDRVMADAASAFKR